MKLSCPLFTFEVLLLFHCLKEIVHSHKCFSPWPHTSTLSSYSDPMTSSKWFSLLLTVSYKLYLNLGWCFCRWQGVRARIVYCSDLHIRTILTLASLRSSLSTSHHKSTFKKATVVDSFKNTCLLMRL